MGWQDKAQDVDENYVNEATNTQRVTSKGEDFKWLRTKSDGNYRLRVLPPGEDRRYAFKLGTHWRMPNPEPNQDSNSPAQVRFMCIEHTFPDAKKHCPICDVLRDYSKRIPDLSEYDADIQYYFNAVIRFAPYNDQMECCPKTVNPTTGDVVIRHSGVHVWSHPETTFKWFDEKRKQVDSWGKVLDPVEGRDIQITKKTKNKRTMYERDMLDKSKLADTDEDIEALLDQRVNFSKVWKFPDDETMAKIVKCAGMLRAMFDNRLGSTNAARVSQNLTGQPPSQQIQQNQAPLQQEMPLQPASQPPTPSFPTHLDDGRGIIWVKLDYKDCYGFPDVYHKANGTKTLQEQMEQCQICFHEWECGETVQKCATGKFVMKRKPA